MKFTIVAISILFSLFSVSYATEVPTVALGDKLFHAENLGTNGKSCATCHPGGKGLDEIDAYDDGMLKEMVNFCIRDAMKGQMMDLESTEVESFLLYLRALQGKK